MHAEGLELPTETARTTPLADIAAEAARTTPLAQVTTETARSALLAPSKTTRPAPLAPHKAIVAAILLGLFLLGPVICEHVWLLIETRVR
jgi:hypothetical protein